MNMKKILLLSFMLMLTFVANAQIDSVLIEEDKDRDGDGEVDCTGDILQIRINCVAFIVVESLLKGSDKGMTPKEYEAYRTEATRQTYMSESTSASVSSI